MNPYTRVADLLSLLLVLLTSLPAFAQIPDTVYRKPELPTGPPTPVQDNKAKPQQRAQEKPVVVQPTQQQEEREDLEFMDRLYFGGSFGLQFGNYTNISLLPILGYKVTDKFSVGPGFVYHFIRTGGQTFQNFGGRVFAQHEVLGGIINSGALLVHAEYEALSYENYWRTNNGAFELTRRMVYTPLAGLGYRQSAGRGSFDLLLLYNFNDVDSPYSNPVIRAGFNIPFRR
ncbi:hypothetical protein ABID22_001707 [Pontibacter aydingkolensis]|uniref:Outer membrane protein beta-barrel domain-containing protein n=1 Tax=Pontibacter aydingkolensis TaxID=1911536 RepID=A0ABS7CUM2_9BACT|nr:hypothetical protein [Pontibacter aydingkolensis]MBW7467371.1 hypothetical protein [Pontibacter aydingkolensis]